MNNHNNSNELYHFGVKGMRWGVRRYQNKDGSLTTAGKKKYSDIEKRINQNNDKIRAINGKTSNHKKDINDIAKNGFNSKRVNFKNSYKDMRDDLEFRKNGKLTKSESNSLKKYLVKDEIKELNKAISSNDRLIKQYMKENKLYDRVLNSLSENQIKNGKEAVLNTVLNTALKDLKTYEKNGIIVDRDNNNRVASISANSATQKQVKRINKMQRKVNRKGDY